MPVDSRQRLRGLHLQSLSQRHLPGPRGGPHRRDARTPARRKAMAFRITQTLDWRGPAEWAAPEGGRLAARETRTLLIARAGRRACDRCRVAARRGRLGLHARADAARLFQRARRRLDDRRARRRGARRPGPHWRRGGQRHGRALDRFLRAGRRRAGRGHRGVSRSARPCRHLVVRRRLGRRHGRAVPAEGGAGAARRAPARALSRAGA